MGKNKTKFEYQEKVMFVKNSSIMALEHKINRKIEDIKKFKDGKILSIHFPNELTAFIHYTKTELIVVYE